MLFLGSFIKVIVNCKSKIATQKDIVGTMMKSIDPDFEDDEHNGISTNLAGGIKNPSDYVMENLSKFTEKEYKELAEYFDENIISLISENMRNTVIKAIYLIIKEDSKIPSDAVVEIISGAKKSELDYSLCNHATFLAGVFLFILRNTNNNQKRGLAKKIAEEYIAKAAKLPDTLTNHSEFVKKKIENSGMSGKCIETNYFSSSDLAIVLGKWDTSKKNDIGLIEEITGKNYYDYRKDIRLDKNLYYEIQGNIDTIVNVNIYRKQLIEEIDEHQFRFLLENVKNQLNQSSILYGISDECIKGISEFITLLSIYPSKNKRLGNSVLHSCLFIFERDVLSNGSYYGIKSLIQMSSILIEADTKAFLYALKSQINDENSKLITILGSENNHEIIYPLADTLRKAAMQDDYFTEAMLLLQRLSIYDRLFDKYLKIIMVPGYPQTIANTDKQIGIITKFYRENPDWTWHFVADMLPGNVLDSYRRLDYEYLPIYIENYTDQDYYARLKSFISFICNNTNRSRNHLDKLMRIIPEVSYDLACLLVDCITSKQVSDDDAEYLWGKLQDILESTTYEEDKEILFNRLRCHLSSGKVEYNIKKIFSYRNLLQKDDEYYPQAEEYIVNLYKKEGVNGIANFSKSIDDTFLLAKIISQKISTKQQLELIDCLSDNIRFRILIIGRISTKDLIKHVKRKPNERLVYLTEHSFDDEIVDYIRTLDTETQARYWKNVYLSACNNLREENFVLVINQLENVKRCADVIKVICYRIIDGKIDEQLLFDILNRYNFDEIDYLNHKNDISNDISNIIKYLQVNAPDRTDEIIEIERKYLHCLVSNGCTSAKHLFYRIANNPEYFYKIVKEEYEKKNTGYYDYIVNTILYYDNIPPGMQLDGTFDFNVFSEWKEFIGNISENDIKEKMIRLFAKSVIFVPKDDDGFILNRQVADFIENCNDDNLLSHIEIELINNVGSLYPINETCSSSPKIDGLREKYEFFANEGYIEISHIYRDVADILEEHLLDDY